MDTIKSVAEMKRSWAKPLIAIKKLARKSDLHYVAILENLEAYENHCQRQTLTPQNQKALLEAIDEDCRGWALERKTGGTQSHYLGTLRKMIHKLLTNQQISICHDSSLWFAQPWAWKLVFDRSASVYAQETFQLYIAVDKWKNIIHGGRAGAWYIISHYIRSVGMQNPDIGLEEGNFNVSAILGKPITTVNVHSQTFVQMQNEARRAHPTMFDSCIQELEGATMYQHITSDFFRALSTHMRAEVTGPYPTRVL